MSFNVSGTTMRPGAASLMTGRRRGPSWFSDHRFAFLLDQIDYGMLVVTCDHGVRYANQSAREALAGDHPLEVRGDEVRARASADAVSLRKALDAARRGLRSLLVLETGTDKGFAGVAVVPLHTTAVRGPMDRLEPEVLLVFGKTSVWGDLSAEWYARLHGLTATETQVLNLLCSGADPAAIARRQGVAVSTIRTQIGSIRAKTGATTVGAVLRKIAMLPPLVCALQPGLEPSPAVSAANA